MRNLQFRSHALSWEDGLLLGNGRTGAVWLGNIVEDRLVLCHSDCWLPHGARVRRTLPAVELLRTVRAMIKEGHAQEAQLIWLKKCKEAGFHYVGTDSCHPAGDIVLRFDKCSDIREYRRSIDPQSGIALVQWDEPACGTWRRESFVSRESDVVVMSITAPSGSTVSADIRVSDARADDAAVWTATTYPPLDKEGWEGTTVPVRDLADITIVTRHGGWGIQGKYRHSRGGWAAAVRLAVTGGTLIQTGESVRVSQAGSIVVIAAVDADTDHVPSLRGPESRIDKAGKRVSALRRHQWRDHGKIYDRASVSLTGGGGTRPCETLVAEAADGPVPAHLWESVWAMGRYLFVSSTRKDGHYPPHLQGLWTGAWKPPWFGCYTNDENVQMMHWQAVSGGMGDLLGPLLRLLRRSRPHWKDNAKDVFGCRGVLAPLQQGGAWARFDQAEWHGWTGGAGWLALHVWDAWTTDGDRTILKEDLLPLLEETAKFYADFLVVGEDGLLHAVPSVSVENCPKGWSGRWTIDATMEISIARQVLDRLLVAHDALEINNRETLRWRKMRSRLPLYRINANGELAEWIHPDHEDNHHHRHLSHLFPVFPGSEMLDNPDPRLLAAASRAVDARQRTGAQSQTGWSLVHLAHVYARLGDGAAAQRCLERMIRTCLQDNLLTVHDDWRGQGMTMGNRRERGTLQLDAIFGATSAMQECLIQSTTDAVILLPALMPGWKRGSANGLGTRCGVKVDLLWDRGGRTASARITATRRTAVRIRNGLDARAPVTQLSMKKGQRVEMVLARKPGASRKLHMIANR